MSEQPIPIGSLRQQTDNRIAVQVAVDYLGLNAPVLVARPDVVHVALTDVDDLEHWIYALGGQIHCGPSTDGACLWTLHTTTPRRANGTTVPIRVHVAVVDGEEVLTEIRSAVTA